MTETVISLALQTAILLETECQDQLGEISGYTAQKYFLKIANGRIEPDPNADSERSFDNVIYQINSLLDSYEKINLLLLVQECLIDLHEFPGFNKKLQKVFRSIGIDSGLTDKFREFLNQNNINEINTNEFLLLSPLNSIDNEMLEGRWIEDNVPKGRDFSGTLKLDQLNSHLVVMFVDQIRSYVIRHINPDEKDIAKGGHLKILRPGNELSIDGVPVLTFSDLKSRFLQISDKRELHYSIEEIEYINSVGYKEIHKFSSIETTGRLIGIVGREGVGKSTLLRLLAGKSKPSSGKISINGYDLWRNKYLLKGVIGFVPEEDLLIEDLSVGENLTITAKLYYSSHSRKEIEARVNQLLSSIDLLDIKHMVVGSIDNKKIQPGQRRLVNIALELLREPQILLVDNALSGLGMSDACRVIKVLHDYSFAGNLVITSISQVDPDTFLLFDKIWILDEGGYPVFNGPVKNAPGYLFKTLKLAFRENEIIDPARLLDWVNYRLPDKESHVWKRVVNPQSWHDQFIREEALQSVSKPVQTRLPARILKIPNLELQLLIFSIRNFKSKFSRTGEIVKALIAGPLVALILTTLLRTGNSEKYTFLANNNIPFYQFVSVVLAIFFGLIASVDEIIRERNIIEKEEYLEFSRFSYLNSKIIYLFPIIAVQILLYVVTANLILGIKEMFWLYWMVLFSCAAFGALLGLVISSDFKKRHPIYKAILPFIIAIQLLLGGGVLSYDRLNQGNHKFTPLLGDLMVSRWGYEILAVEHFKKNAYEKLVYQHDQKLDQAAFYAFQAVPRMEQSFYACMNSTDEDSIRDNINLLGNEFRRAATIPGVSPFEYLKQIGEMRKKEEVAEEVSGYLTYLSYHFHDQYDTITQHRTDLIGRLADSLGASELAQLRQDYHNLALQETVTQSNREETFRVIDNEIIRTTGMIFDTPRSQWGRAALFSPVKFFYEQRTETKWFNLSVIWFLTAICYVWVLFDITGLIRSVFRKNY